MDDDQRLRSQLEQRVAETIDPEFRESARSYILHYFFDSTCSCANRVPDWVNAFRRGEPFSAKAVLRCTCQCKSNDWIHFLISASKTYGCDMDAKELSWVTAVTSRCLSAAILAQMLRYLPVSSIELSLGHCNREICRLITDHAHLSRVTVFQDQWWTMEPNRQRWLSTAMSHPRLHSFDVSTLAAEFAPMDPDQPPTRTLHVLLNTWVNAHILFLALEHRLAPWTLATRCVKRHVARTIRQLAKRRCHDETWVVHTRSSMTFALFLRPKYHSARLTRMEWVFADPFDRLDFDMDQRYSNANLAELSEHFAMQLFTHPLFVKYTGPTSAFIDRRRLHQDDGWSTVCEQFRAHPSLFQDRATIHPFARLPWRDCRLRRLVQAFVGQGPTMEFNCTHRSWR